jgi:CheY-like chemotaxis protein
MTNNGPIRVLIVDDEDSMAYIVQRVFRPFGSSFQVRLAMTLKAGLEALRTWEPDVIVADYILPDGRGTDILEHVPLVPAVIITGYESAEVKEEAYQKGAVELFVKREGLFSELPRITCRALQIGICRRLCTDIKEIGGRLNQAEKKDASAIDIDQLKSRFESINKKCDRLEALRALLYYRPGPGSLAD